MRTSPNKRFNEQNNVSTRAFWIFVHFLAVLCKTTTWNDKGPVHTNPFSNEKGAVLSVFKKTCVHSYRFRIVFVRPHYNADQERGQHSSVCRPFWILTVAWSGARSCLCDDVIVSDSTSFSLSTLENSVFKSLHSGDRFRMAPFSVIDCGVVVWTIALSGAKQLRFRLKTD